MTGMADEGAFVFDNRMAGYGAEPTPERPTDGACERRFVARLLPHAIDINRLLLARPRSAARDRCC